MADINIDGLAAAGALTGTDLLEIFQSPENRKVLLSALKTFMLAGGAADIDYDNTSSGLTAADVQDAIDELDARTVIVPIGIAVADETTALTTGTAKVTFRMPYAMTLTGVRASVTTAPTGSTLIVDINEDAGSGSATILSTKLSIDAGAKTSTTASSAAVISDTALADDAEITIDIDQVGSTIAGAGLKVWLIGYKV